MFLNNFGQTMVGVGEERAATGNTIPFCLWKGYYNSRTTTTLQTRKVTVSQIYSSFRP